ncbi:hypothetical protein PM10SUCC1_12660 [Propionigenium maris DSM 9537]|uniref:site-specific DNA-methyltransferase (adenine-specific) n=1 Tax=Propionigenium maris DSM 9537 TaxID=1123000 RepID=A0A9W6GLG3_9FUSO|nr:TaqI-like C-terminal specificity domain-containing protein [Propionigenium maris]GLI55752.1 hypothetical protein PM10SUCC1_12660 [Propionigenium maris DSM 9537]
MRKKQKLELIAQLVEMPFEEESYREFLEKVLGGELFENAGQNELVGELVQDDEVIGLFQIECRGLKDFFRRSRVQRNYLGSLLKRKYRKRYRRVLAAFYAPDEEIWRLSLVKLDEAFSSGETIPIRMTSHIMGCGKRNRAAIDMIGLFLEKPKKKGLRGISLVFDQEKMLDEFFKCFSEVFYSLREDLKESEEILRIALDKKRDVGELADVVAKRVATQMIVLYFIEKKGWLGAPKEKSIEDGDHYFIEKLYSTCSRDGKNFYGDYLEPLFHKGFNTWRGEENYMEEFECRVPYFNIDIFKPYLGVDWEKHSIKVEDRVFYNDGRGMLELFERYYFSLMENEPHLGDMVVDPEMIGKVFENLLDTDYRRSKGTYYTPRKIVHFMCKATLVNYLYKKIEKLKEEDIKNFIFLSEFYWDEDKGIVKRGGRSENLHIPEGIYRRIHHIEAALKDIKVVEPSTGSGAFLLGMLGELLKIREVVGRYVSVYDQLEMGHQRVAPPMDENFLLKGEIVENNLYGVDIEELAVESSKLRFWMSLMSDAPEYDYKKLLRAEKNLVAGNSITMRWEDQFSEIFMKNKGFDIVIGNPPYVGEKGNKEIFREIIKTPLGEKFYRGKGDLFYFFFHLGLDILKERGTLAYITTNYYITADGAVKLREDIRCRSTILQMIDFNEVSIFSRAKGQHNIISILEKSKDNNRVGKTSLCNTKGELTAMEMSSYLARKYNEGSYSSLKQNEFYRGEKSYIRLEKNKISEILEKVLAQGIPLKEEVNINQGLVSGADRLTRRHIEKFGIDGEKGEGIYSLDKIETERLSLNEKERKHLTMFYKNSHIKRYRCEETSDRELLYITKDDKLEDLPNISKHLLRYKKILENKREARQGRLPWYSLHWPREREIFTGEKIVAPQRSRENVFAYTDREWFASADVYYITKKTEGRLSLKYILALLNSKLYYIWLYKRGKRKGELLELYATPLEELPVKVIDFNAQKAFIDIVDEIIERRSQGVESRGLEDRLDEMVCELYALDKDERDEIYKFYRGKLEAK